MKIEIRGQYVNLKKIEGSNCNFFKNLRGQFTIFWKFIGVKLKILKKLRIKMQNLKDYNNAGFWNSYILGDIWNSLNLTWTKYFINFHHFENSSNYYPNNVIHLKVFEFSHNVTFLQNIPSSKTL